MKATGIVRRIDDLGRVVIPKEIRRTLRLREGTPLEIFIDKDGEIILKKYSPMMELSAFAKQYADAMAQASGHIICVSDRDQIIAIAGASRKEMLSQSVSKQLEQAIINREFILAEKGDKTFIPITSSMEEDYMAQVVAPIISEGDAIGSVIILSREAKTKMGEVEQKLAVTAAAFLGKQMES